MANVNEVIAWYASNAPRSLDGLRGPAPHAELAALQLPAELFALFSVCDGEERNSVGILPQFQLLSLADARELRDMVIGITAPPVVDEEPRYSGFTRSEIEASGHWSTEFDYPQAEDGSEDVPGIPTDLSPAGRLEREERELQRVGELLEFFNGSAEDYRRQQESELDGYRFTVDHLPIAEWDSACIAVEISTGLVFEWEPVDGRSRSWPSLGAMFSELLAALTGGPPFMWWIPVVVDGAVEWEFDESVLESEQPAPTYDEPEPVASDWSHVDVIEFVIDLTTFEGVADYLGGERRSPSSIAFEALESADFTTAQRGRVTLLEFVDSVQADAFRAFAAAHTLHIATLGDQFAIVADTAEGAAALQSSVTFD